MGVFFSEIDYFIVSHNFMLDTVFDAGLISLYHLEVMIMTSNTIQGIEAYEHYSKGIWGLAGDSMRDTRQRLMYLITGESLPKAKCGVTALEVAYLTAKSQTEVQA